MGPRVMPKDKLCQPVEIPIRLQHGEVILYDLIAHMDTGEYVLAYLQRIFSYCLPTDYSQDSWELGHDAHLPALSHLFGIPGPWKAQGQKKS
ncbi:hypothetical protein EVAR_72707_1 [Eumeta japonica]|uniref:Uncharacterized protein n=1 Tax=Eumeta variegata TaxID=151549 RepID=A0A4C1SSJ7_EUMVA|nr:hypothetical protein EVAR_72707_1 [Eumeta japonica]